VLSQWREAGKTIVLVTHQPGVLERTADEFITMSKGSVIEQRHMREVLA
jgi:ABC-type glutathione transport system ATPase component